MNYVVPSCTLRNLKSIGMGANSFCNLVRSKPFTYQGLMIPSRHLEVSSINQDPIINIKVSSFFHMNGASFVVDSFEDVVDVFMHGSNSVAPFFCSGGGEFVVVIELYDTRMKAIETSVG